MLIIPKQSVHKLRPEKRSPSIHNQPYMKLAILLTATVKVQVVGGNFTVAERAEMYASALRYYARTDRQIEGDRP